MVLTTGSEWIGPKHHRRTAIEYFAGIDVSLEQDSVCVVDTAGKIIRKANLASEPEHLVRFFRELGVWVTRIGLEARPLSQWLHAGLSEAGFEAVSRARTLFRHQGAEARAHARQRGGGVDGMSGIEIVRAVPDLRGRLHGWREAGARLALVPTMGALHEGHLTLVRH